MSHTTSVASSTTGGATRSGSRARSTVLSTRLSLRERDPSGAEEKRTVSLQRRAPGAAGRAAAADEEAAAPYQVESQKMGGRQHKPKASGGHPHALPIRVVHQPAAMPKAAAAAAAEEGEAAAAAPANRTTRTTRRTTRPSLVPPPASPSSRKPSRATSATRSSPAGALPAPSTRVVSRVSRRERRSRSRSVSHPPDGGLEGTGSGSGLTAADPLEGTPQGPRSTVQPTDREGGESPPGKTELGNPASASPKVAARRTTSPQRSRLLSSSSSVKEAGDGMSPQLQATTTTTTTRGRTTRTSSRTALPSSRRSPSAPRRATALQELPRPTDVVQRSKPIIMLVPRTQGADAQPAESKLTRSPRPSRQGTSSSGAATPLQQRSHSSATQLQGHTPIARMTTAHPSSVRKAVNADEKRAVGAEGVAVGPVGELDEFQEHHAAGGVALNLDLDNAAAEITTPDTHDPEGPVTSTTTDASPEDAQTPPDATPSAPTDVDAEIGVSPPPRCSSEGSTATAPYENLVNDGQGDQNEMGAEGKEEVPSPSEAPDGHKEEETVTRTEEVSVDHDTTE